MVFSSCFSAKKDGTNRLCVDYRELNKTTIDDKQPLPLLQDIFDRLHGAKYFTTLDVAWGYWHVQMHSESVPKTAFVTNDGHYEFLVMPFGLKNAASTFQKIIQQVIGTLLWKGVCVFQDDIIIYSSSFSQHMNLIKQVFEKLLEYNIKLKFNKCSFAQSEVKYLGHIIGHNKWTPQVDKSFIELKAALTSEQILTTYNPEVPCKLYTDASAIGIAGILSQEIYSTEHVISYYSKKLLKHQQNYSAYELECYAVIQEIDYFEVYLENKPFQVITDHSALQWLLNLKNPKSKFFRWLVNLSTKTFTITHRSGNKLTQVDALSRAPVLSISIFELQQHQRQADLSFIEDPQDHQNTVMVKKRGLLRAMVLASFKEHILKEYHDNMSHPSMNKTVKLIVRLFWWSDMVQEIKSYVRSCKTCQLTKSSNQPTLGQLIIPDTELQPAQTVRPRVARAPRISLLASDESAVNMPNSASPRSPGPAGQEPGRPSILSPTGGKNSPKDELHREISRENSANKDYANPPTGVGNANLAVARGDVTSGLPPATSSNGAARALRNWADCPEDQGPGADDDFTVVRTKKRRRESANSPTAAAPSSNIGGARTSRRPQSSAGSVPRAQEVRTTRAHITEARARQASSSEDHCVYLEHGPELQPFHYLRALDRMLGGTAGVIQVSKVNGHQLLGLANRGLAERLINEGLEVEGTLLRAFPFRKRAERITVGNLPFFVEDSAIISALKPYGRVTSIAPKLMKAGPYTYNDGRREAFIVLREGMRTERLPTRLEIPIKGEAWPAYLSSGIKCSRCHGQGHRRANCPLLAGRTNAPRPATPTSPTSVPPVTAPGLPQQPSAHPPPPASPSPAMETPSASPAARAVTPSAAPRPSTPVAPAVPVEMAPPAPPPVTPAPSLRAPGGSVSPQSTKSGPPAQDIEMTAIEESSASSTTSSRTSMRDDLVAFIRTSPTVSFTGTDALGLGREEVLDLLSSRTKAQRKRWLLTPPQTDALAGLIKQILGLKPAGNTNVYKILHQVKSELKKGPAAVPPTPPLPAPWPAEPAPPAPQERESTPAMATRCDELRLLTIQLMKELNLWPQLDTLYPDLVEAVLCPEDRKGFLRRLFPEDRKAIIQILDKLSEHTRDLHSLTLRDLSELRAALPTCWTRAWKAQHPISNRWQEFAERRITSEISRENSANKDYANPPTGVGNANLAVARGDVTSGLPPATSSNGAARALRNWADCPEDQGPGADDDFTVVRTKKRRRESANSPTAAAPSSNIGGARTSRRPQSSAGSVPRAQEVRTTRAHITEARARQASSPEDHCVYLEHGPELQPFHYLRALDRMLGGTAGVIQVSKDSAIISALKPYGRVTSIAPKLMKAGPYTYNDGRREAFIVLREGMTAERLPTRLEIPIKGEAWPAYLSSGIKCSRCHGQGHRRANCPLLAGRTNAPRPATPTSPTSVPPVTAPGLPQQPSAHPPPPASSSPAMEIPSASPAARAVTPSAAPRPSTPVAPAVSVEMAPPAPPPVTPAPSLRAPGGSVSPQSTKSGPPAQDIEMTAIEESSASSTSSSRTSMRDDLVAFIRRSPTVSFTGTDALGLGREEVLDLLSSRTKAQRKRWLLTPPQTDALAGLIKQILGLKPAGNTNVYKILHQVKSELKKGPAAVPPTPPLPAPWPAEPAPAAPQERESTPAMATRCDELRLLTIQLMKELNLWPQLDTLYPDLVEATVRPRVARAPRISLLASDESAVNMPNSISPRSPGPAGQEPGRPSILSPTGGKNSLKDELHREISRENSANKDYANPPTGVGNANLAVARGDVTSGLPQATSSNGAARALRNWADCPEDQGPGADDDFTVVRTKKRRRESANSPTAAAPSFNIGGARTSRRLQSSAGSVPRAQEVRTTRAHITEARARQASSSEDHCVYLEHGPELQPFHYLRALDRMLGGTAGVIQVSKDSAIISALKPYGRVTSIAPKLMKAGPYTYNDGRREAFIVLREGMTTERLPTRLEIPIKGEAWPAYLSSGIKCSRCHGQGHRRANCPLLAGRTNAPRPATPISPTSVPPVTAPGLPRQPSAHPPPPASPSPAMETPSASPAARAVTPSAAPRPSTPVAPAVPVEMAPLAPPPVTPAPSLRAPGGSVSPQSTKSGPPAQDIEMTAIEESSASSTSSSRTSMRDDLVAFIQRSPTVSFTGTDALGLGREEVLDLLSSRTKAQRKRGLLTPPQTDALAGLIEQILGLKPAGNTNVYKILHQVKSELKKGPAAVPPTPSLPALQHAGPTPPVPHGVETKPAMATPPPPLPTPMEEEHVDHVDLMEDLFEELNSDTELKPLLDSGYSSYDIVYEFQKYVNPPAGGQHANPAAPTNFDTASFSEAAAQANRSWADLAEDNNPEHEDNYTTVQRKKRRRGSAESPAAAAPSSNIRGAGAIRRPRSSTGWAPRAEEIRTTRAHIAEARARQASSTEDHCVYVERSPELEPFHYMRAIERMFGSTREVFQVTKMNGHFLVGLANRGMAERLVNEGLEVEGTLHRAFPFRKRAERITVGNLPFFVGDATVISALSAFGRVTSIAPKLMKAGPYVYNDGRREAFIILREGMTIERLPTRLDISIKGEAWPAYLSSGIRCSRCRGQGHRRANCPLLAGRTNAPGPATPTSPTSVPSATAPGLPQQPSAQPPPSVSPSPTMELSDVPPTSRAGLLPPAAPRPPPPAPLALPVEDTSPAPPPVIPAPSLRAPGGSVSPQSSKSEPSAQNIEMTAIEESSASSTSSSRTSMRDDLVAFIRRSPPCPLLGRTLLVLGGR
ncbi:hypothetical protein LAZ67_12000024, partial [Cordylochernes scorpioides]